MGLAKIRDGDLDEGTREIETAASLDPNNSLVRSYLGKAYYEQKRDGLASSEYEQAKLLDPKDPTPWFYDAIHKQTTNRPVEALHDLQRAIELNDNRAVYRSKFLLDQDLAARGAARGRIYSDLGFQQLAFIEGWQSINIDPTDYSSHRLLADTYSALPRHEIARVSELLQSQLLQPINITPVQPQLAESTLFLLGGLGPADASLGEFNPLFFRDQFVSSPQAPWVATRPTPMRWFNRDCGNICHIVSASFIMRPMGFDQTMILLRIFILPLRNMLSPHSLAHKSNYAIKITRMAIYESCSILRFESIPCVSHWNVTRHA